MRRISVSALAWPETEERAGLHRVCSLGVTELEHVPARCAALSDGEFTQRRLQPVAFQSLLHKTEKLPEKPCLFGSDAQRDALLSHLRAVLAQAARAGVEVVVFGSPRARSFDETILSAPEAEERALVFFRRLGESAHACGVVFCLEPNPASYECNFLTRTLDAAAFVRNLNCKGIALNLDVGAMAMNGEDPGVIWPAVRDVTQHIHVSEPFLAPVGAMPSTHPLHAGFAEVLRKTDPQRRVSIEMVAKGDRSEWEGALESALDFVRRVYG
ncbi:MAG: TIM barrel protein [Silvanigrellales bacterium]|nr:TIM barrel protein [Silvanigrellales bacterium]